MGHDSLKGQFRVGSITEGHDFIGIHKHFTMEDTWLFDRVHLNMGAIKLLVTNQLLAMSASEMSSLI